MHTFWAMYILGLHSSWGTSWICPSWSPSEHLLTPALSPFWGARVRSHTVRRRLFIVLMTAALISPNVFPSERSLATYSNYFIKIHNDSTQTYYTSHSYIHLHFFILHILFTSSFLLIFKRGWLLSAPCVRYNKYPSSRYGLSGKHFLWQIYLNSHTLTYASHKQIEFAEICVPRGDGSTDLRLYISIEPKKLN